MTHEERQAKLKWLSKDEYLDPVNMEEFSTLASYPHPGARDSDAGIACGCEICLFHNQLTEAALDRIDFALRQLDKEDGCTSA